MRRRSSHVICGLKDALSSFFGSDDDDEPPEEAVVRREVRDALEGWLQMSAAIAVSGGATSDFSANGGFPARPKIRSRVQDAEAALKTLVDACATRAPALVAEPMPALQLARLATWIPQEQWQRPLDEWEGPGEGADADACAASLRRHLLEQWETPEFLHGALGLTGDERSASVPEAAHRASYAFSAVLAAAGSGAAPVRASLDEAIAGADSKACGGPVVSKSVAKFLAAPRADDAKAANGRPLHLLRRAQVAAMGAAPWVGDGVCRSTMGSRFLGAGSADASLADDGCREGVSEAYGAALISWVCTHAEALSEPSEVATAIDYALEMRGSPPSADYSLAGRTPKTVGAALEAYALTNVQFDNDEIFEPNPHGVGGLLAAHQTIPDGIVVSVPYDEPRNGGPGEYQLGASSPDGRGSRPCTVRVAEIGSLRRLVLEGQRLNNCLETRYDSQLKYVMRVRQRSSSFWSFTLQYDDAPDEPPVHILLAEVWHLRQGNIIRQAEGPRPRTLPGPEAWYWLDQWCAREGIDVSTWDVYSRVTAPVAPPPVL